MVDKSAKSILWTIFASLSILQSTIWTVLCLLSVLIYQNFIVIPEFDDSYFQCRRDAFIELYFSNKTQNEDRMVSTNAFYNFSVAYLVLSIIWLVNSCSLIIGVFKLRGDFHKFSAILWTVLMSLIITTDIVFMAFLLVDYIHMDKISDPFITNTVEMMFFIASKGIIFFIVNLFCLFGAILCLSRNWFEEVKIDEETFAKIIEELQPIEESNEKLERTRSKETIDSAISDHFSEYDYFSHYGSQKSFAADVLVKLKDDEKTIDNNQSDDLPITYASLKRTKRSNPKRPTLFKVGPPMVPGPIIPEPDYTPPPSPILNLRPFGSSFI